MHLWRKLEGKLWIPHKRIDSKAPYPARVSPLYFRLVVIFKKKFVFCATSFYNWIGVWIRIITTVMRDREKYFLRVAWVSFLALLICGCVGKKPDDDVALIKQLLAILERGINQRNEAVLDSTIQDKKKDLASQLLDSLSIEGKFESARITSKMFVVVQDSAEVRLRLGLRLGLRLSAELVRGEQETKEIEKPVKLFLHKKRGKWKINRFSMEGDER